MHWAKIVLPLVCMGRLAWAEPILIALEPPLLTEATVLQKLSCERPVREGSFRIGAERASSKLLVHCYGMGGVGWTTLFGSVERAIDAFEKKAAFGERQKPIRVVGAGCMGLTAAVELARKGYKVAGITAASLYDTPSWKAAGCFTAFSLKMSPQEQTKVHAIALDTFRAYQRVERGDHPYLPKECVRFLPLYCSQSGEVGVEELEARGWIPPKEEVMLDFGPVRRGPFWRYYTYFMDTEALMRHLLKEAERLGIAVTVQSLESFEQVQEAVIFNCTGLGAAQLCRDEKVVPVRGHLVLLNAQAGDAHMDYMLFAGVMQEGRQETLYMFPKAVAVSSERVEAACCRSVIGGTFLEDDPSRSLEEQNEIDRREWDKILERASLFFTGRPFGH